MSDVIIQLSIVILIATAIAIIGRFVRQPPLIAYILTGILIGQFGVDITANKEMLDVAAELGIILLLFIAGLKIKFSEFLKVGKLSLIIGEGHDVIMLSLGVIIGYFLMGLTGLQSFYLALALTLSSTIVVVKILTDRKEVAAPHGKILMGTMLLQDLVAMGSLAIFTSLAVGGNPTIEILLTLAKSILLFGAFYYFGKYVLTRLFEKIAEHIELVFLFGLTWCFTGVLIAHGINFSKEIGAFIAGMAIAHLPFSFEVEDKARALQDFGLLLFFFTIGATITISKEIFLSWTFLLLCLFVIFATPIITGTIGSFLGFDKKKNFLMSTLPIQVSEFSIIIMAIGLKLGQITEYLFSLVVGITVVTIIFSSSIMSNANKLFKVLEKHLDFLEWKKVRVFKPAPKLRHHIVIFGYGNLGQNVTKFYKKMKKEIVVIDWVPELVEKAKKKGCHIIYGDAGDPDLWSEASLKHADVIINTIGRNIDDDINLGRWIRKNHPKVVSVAETNVPSEVAILKKAGYDHVIYQDQAEWEELKRYLSSPKIRRRVTKKR